MERKTFYERLVPENGGLEQMLVKATLIFALEDQFTGYVECLSAV